MKLKRRHAIVVLLIVLVALALILNWFPQIQNNSLIVAGSILATAIELYGFVKDRKSKNESQYEFYFTSEVSYLCRERSRNR